MVWDDEEDELPEVADELEPDVVLWGELEPDDVEDVPDDDVPDELPEEEVPAAVACSWTAKPTAVARNAATPAQAPIIRVRRGCPERGRRERTGPGTGSLIASSFMSASLLDGRRRRGEGRGAGDTCWVGLLSEVPVVPERAHDRERR